MIRAFIAKTIEILIVFPALIYLISTAISARLFDKKDSNSTPRLIYGPVPIISLKYMREAMEHKGYFAKTFVYYVYHINSRQDFDYFLEDFFDFPGWLPKQKTLLMFFGHYLAFSWLIFNFDVFHCFFNGGFLKDTPLRFLEAQILHLAGKKLVVMPYGSDVAVPSQIKSLVFRQGLLTNYPEISRNEKQTKRQIDYYTEHADFIIGCLFHIETLPRWDLLTTLYYPIDLTKWLPSENHSDADGVNKPVVVAHTPNHKGLKGSEFLVKACEELKSEGFKIDLRLIQGLPNEEVKKILYECDILAEQFIIGYALSAIEGMALGKPVMSNISDDDYFQVHRLYTGLDECPIVVTPIEEIKKQLESLITNPQKRKELGEAGRRYAEKFHSYDSAGNMWNLVYRKIWNGEEIDLKIWHPDKFSQIKD